MARKYIKGLFSDTRPIDQPEGTYPFGKNGVQDYKKLATINEPGFIPITSAVIPYTHMGTIETDLNPIIFSTDDTNSCIGFFDPINEVYTPIFDDTSLSFKMRFQRANYITGEYQKSQLGEYIAVFTDKVLPFRYINCTNPAITKPEDMLFFLRATAPTMVVSSESGGQLPTGSYVVYIKYARVDGSETAYLISSAPVIVSGINGSGISSQAIRINLSGCDTTYDFVIVGIIESLSGVTSAIELNPIGLSENMSILFTGNNTSTASTPEDILIQPAVYSRVGCLTQLNDALFLGNLSQLPQVKYQPYANLIQVRWVSQEVDMTNIPPSILSGLEKGFAHGEIYALYIRLKMTDGTKSPAFLIPGRLSQSGETDTITDGGMTAKRFQIHDTPVSISAIDRSGSPCYWENATELYPDTIDYDSTALGGPNLRNQPVRHHKMPTHHWVMNNFNVGDTTYGRSKLDILGIKLSNIVIPAELQNQVDSYEILYAQRTTGNMTVLGQSDVTCCAQSLSLHNSGSPTNFVSSGGNWNSVASVNVNRSLTNPSDAPLCLVNTRVRMHPFELLFNNIQLPTANCYLQFEWKLRMDRITNRIALAYGVNTNVPSGSREDSDATAVGYGLDFKQDPYSTVSPTADSDFIAAFNTLQYAPNNVNGGEWNNTDLETCVVGHFLTRGCPTISVSGQNVVAGKTSFNKLNTNNYVQNEEMFIGTIRVLRPDVYNSVLSQSLVSTGTSFKITQTSTTPIYAGDTFPCDYTVNQYGWINDYNLANGPTPNLCGVKVIRRFVCESTANINQRYEITGNAYSQWYPHESVSYQNAYILPFDRTQDPNQFGYSKDLNALNNLESIPTFTPYTQYVNEFPYRIARGGVFKREGMQAAWRTLLPLDYYDMPKNKGIIVNLAGLNDNLLIHHQDALFITQDKTTLKGDVLSVTLGAGDIFQYVPLEGLQTKLGYGGTKQDLSAVVTPMGYMFVDTDMGQVFIFKGTLKLLNNGLNIFFRDNLPQLTANNPYIGNGITIGYDPKFNRVLMTVKNLQVSSDISGDIVPNYEPTVEFFDTLIANESIIYNNGTWMKFMGINTTEFNCPASPDGPTISNATFTIPDSYNVGAFVGTISASSPSGSALTWLIVSGNTAGAFRVDISGNLLVAAGVLNYNTIQAYSLDVRVIDTNGLSADATITVNITQTVKAPTISSYIVYFDEKQPNGTHLQTVAANDPDGLSLTFSIIAGNSLGTFTMNDITGEITVADTTSLVYATNPIFYLQTQVTNGTYQATGMVTVYLNDVTPPTFSGASATIPSTTAPGTLILTGTPATDAEATSAGRTLTYLLESESNPGVFNTNIDPTSPDFLQVTLNSGETLTPGATYTVVVRVTDQGDPGQQPTYTDATYTINVEMIYYNVEQIGTLQRNNCGSGMSGTYVPYDISAGTYTSTISQADADAQALAAAQTYVNTNGTCLVNSTLATLLVDYYVESGGDYSDADLCFYIEAAGVSEEDTIVASTANGGPLQLPNDGSDPSVCYLLSSDKLPGPPIRRFAANIAYFIAKYPSINVFTFRLRGRTATAQVCTGLYALRDITGGHLTMGDFGGGLQIPSVSSGSPADTTYSSNIISGADGSVGTTVGSPILDLVVTVSPPGVTDVTY